MTRSAARWWLRQAVPLTALGVVLSAVILPLRWAGLREALPIPPSAPALAAIAHAVAVVMLAAALRGTSRSRASLTALTWPGADTATWWRAVARATRFAVLMAAALALPFVVAAVGVAGLPVARVLMAAAVATILGLALVILPAAALSNLPGLPLIALVVLLGAFPAFISIAPDGALPSLAAGLANSPGGWLARATLDLLRGHVDAARIAGVLATIATSLAAAVAAARRWYRADVVVAEAPSGRSFEQRASSPGSFAPLDRWIAARTPRAHVALLRLAGQARPLGVKPNVAGALRAQAMAVALAWVITFAWRAMGWGAMGAVAFGCAALWITALMGSFVGEGTLQPLGSCSWIESTPTSSRERRRAIARSLRWGLLPPFAVAAVVSLAAPEPAFGILSVAAAGGMMSMLVVIAASMSSWTRLRHPRRAWWCGSLPPLCGALAAAPVLVAMRFATRLPDDAEGWVFLAGLPGAFAAFFGAGTLVAWWLEDRGGWDSVDPRYG